MPINFIEYMPDILLIDEEVIRDISGSLREAKIKKSITLRPDSLLAEENGINEKNSISSFEKIEKFCFTECSKF